MATPTKLLTLFLLTVTFFLASCHSGDTVSPQELAQQQAVAAQQYNVELLAQAKTAFENENFDEAERILNEITNSSPESAVLQAATQLQAEAEANRAVLEEKNEWARALATTSTETVYSYLAKHPNSTHKKEAAEKIKQLKIENEQAAYESALSSSSSSAWKQFLSDYPNRYDKAEIKRRIIIAEISEIRNQEGVQQLPEGNYTGGGSGSTSRIEITNSTDRLLTIRYSGPDVTTIDIPSHGTRTISLSNGSYDVAATAGGLSCAGQERLHGNYSSRYYISNSRY